MTPETKVKQRIKQVLNSAGAYHFWPVQTGFGNKTLDCLACYKGQFIGIEAKAEGNKPTALQDFTIRQITDAGGKVFVIDNEEGAQELKDYLLTLKWG